MLTRKSLLGDGVARTKDQCILRRCRASHFGTGWWSGVLSTFCGVLSFGAVLCLHFPQVLSSPELRPHYPMHTMRILIECLIVAAIVFGLHLVISAQEEGAGIDRLVIGTGCRRAGRIKRADQ
jgi:hypothetical protein